MNTTKPKKEYLIYLLLFIWPFLYLFQYAIAGQSFSLKLRMDVVHFYYVKVYLLDALANFRIPLWSPGEACGFPFFSSPYNQAFYPLNFLLAIYYKLTGGFSWVDYQRFSILGVSLFAMFLYGWLRALKVHWRAALLATLIMCVSFKITGVLNRYQATHAIAWMTFILWGVTESLYADKRKKGWLFTAIGVFMFLTNAYPYYIYYAIFLIPPYVLVLLFKKTRTALVPLEEISIIRFLTTISTAALVPLILCLPYLYKLNNLKNVVSDRSSDFYRFAVGTSSNFTETLGSLVNPAYANDKGWYYFGFIALFLMIAYSIQHFYPLTKKKEKKSFLFLIVGFWVLISLLTYGKSFLFNIFWKVFPGYSSLATWGRLNIVLIPFLALFLAKAYQFWENILSNPESRIEGFKKRSYIFAAIMLGAYLLILGIQVTLQTGHEYNFSWTRKLAPQFPNINPTHYLYFGAVYFIVIIGTLLISSSTKLLNNLKATTLTTLLPICLLILSSINVGVVGAKLRSVPRTAGAEKRIINIEEINNRAFTTPRTFEKRLSGLYTKKPYSALLAKRWFYTNYNDFLKNVGAIGKWDPVLHGLKPKAQRPPAVDQFLGLEDGKRLYFIDNITFSNRIKSQQLEDFLQNAEDYEITTGFQNQVIHYNGDYLEVLTRTNQQGYLCFIDNWDEDWKARIDGKEVAIDKLFGTFKAIKVPEGDHIVQFHYHPFPISLVKGFPEAESDASSFANMEKVTEKAAIKKPKIAEGSQQDRLGAAIKAPNVIQWTDTVGLLMTKENKLIKNTDKGWFSSGAFSKNQLALTSNGCVEIVPSTDNYSKARVIGFSDKNINAHYKSIDYGIRLNGKGKIEILENGERKGKQIAYAPNDTIRIELIDKQIYYRHKGKIIYQSTTPVTEPLHVDVSLFTKGISLEDVKCSF